VLVAAGSEAILEAHHSVHEICREYVSWQLSPVHHAPHSVRHESIGSRAFARIDKIDSAARVLCWQHGDSFSVRALHNPILSGKPNDTTRIRSKEVDRRHFAE